MKIINMITDKEQIQSVFQNANFGTLALCSNNKPYSVPINFVKVEDEIYFHGALKGKKITMLEENSYASFSVVEDVSFIPSYFSTDTQSANRATHMYKSVITEGKVFFINDYEEKVKALNLLMQKYQSEGGYKPLDDEMYKKIIDATSVYKLTCEELSAKFYLGQHFTQERFERVKEHLLKRGTKQDLQTLKLIEEFRK